MTKNIIKKFPTTPSLDSLIKNGAIPIRDMTYFKLELNGKVGIYKPIEEGENEIITNYTLKNIFHKKINSY